MFSRGLPQGWLDHVATNPRVRSLLWRIGRRLYTHSRGETLNDSRTNGEFQLQALVADLFLAGGETRPFVALDVGANIGEWTDSMLAACAKRRLLQVRVIAFEPVPSTRALFEKRIGASPLGQSVRLEPFAMSGTKGEIEMHIRGAGAGTNSVHFDPSDPGRNVVTVKTETVDDYLVTHAVQEVDLLKCDTEGHDFSVLEGARASLAAGRIRVLQFEYNHRWVFARRYLLDVFRLIDDLPYRLGRLRPTGIELIDTWHPELERFFEANFVLVHRDISSRLRGVTTGTIDASNVYVANE